ncbi:DUF1206 domain-containing protein [Brachybacterium squillarum]|uniref:DUF1206 domain-containing protein n=1 Tax=Brachybacterium squillarum TaxID=661979 RepID=UPI002222BAD1|nr:DUF1206 domain-containing protein [Brachybacterium squillarum]MCW1804098.1 DUF1206 domain-containing protein [Brachybacterium squillarum]
MEMPQPEDARRAARRAEDTARRAEDAAEEVAEHPVFEGLARAGFVVSGLVHLLIGAIALRIAFGSGGEADQSGALRSVASAPGGPVLLWAGGIAMIALALWHVAEAWFGARQADGRGDAAQHVVKTLGKAIVYAALASTALRFAIGSGSSSEQQTDSVTAALMTAPAGRLLVGVVALVIIGIGIYHVVAGVTRRFEKQLEGRRHRTISRAVTVSGTAGYVAKGVALVAVGALFGWATITADPDKAGGLDAALSTMASLPAGTVLLALVGVGLILFGVFSILRSRYADM